MILHEWGPIPYIEAMEGMRRIHGEAVEDGKAHLILCSHPAVFTVGRGEKREFPVETVGSDRGGSISCHSEGQAIFYFCFQVEEATSFHRRVCRVFSNFFRNYLPSARYERERPGWYIENRKIASIALRYGKSVSMHGVALNADVDLLLHSLVPPCNLEGVLPTSLKAEGVCMDVDGVFEKTLPLICDIFGERVEERRGWI